MKSAFWAAAAAVAFVLGHASAQDQPAGQPGQPAWTLITEHHKELAKSVGTWDVKAEFHMMGQVLPFTAVAKREMILGGKYLAETFTCNLAGQPFEGRLLQGYDTVRKQYVSVWVDNMKPVMAVARGNVGEGGKLVMTAEEPEGMTGKLVKRKSVVEPSGEDSMTMSTYKVTDQGEQLFMKLIYTRRKK